MTQPYLTGVDMVNRIILFFARLIFEFRLKRLERIFGKTKWQPSLDLIVSLTNVIPVELLTKYTPTLGRQIDLVIGFKNCHELLLWIDEVNNLIIKKEYIHDKYLFPNLNQRQVSLDDFLTNNNNGDVDILQFYLELQQALQNLYNTFQSNEDLFTTYYRGRLGVSLQNIYTIQEGLLRVAMNV